MMDDSTIYESNVLALVPETVPGPRPDNLQFRQAHVPVHSCVLTEYIRIYVNSNILYASE
ncbi:hypothetical protein JV07_09660 [Salmonella enterica]|nr:hypothetical protein [Salmonella enterica]EAY4988042.1 hypothetical protein [Salmonella enterica]ECI6759115.1 hypothetical protein [Salmonella enterica subsp. enterica serovar Mbandaka]